MRLLGIPTVVDRLVQQAILQVLEPILNPMFSASSFGFRPGRSAHQADHDVLIARLARRLGDKRLLRIVRAFLNAGMMQGGVVIERYEGTPQGGPLSPLLANLLLNDLDKKLERRGHRFCRYAGDCNIYVRSEAAGERVMGSVVASLKQLRLKVNRQKSADAPEWERSFPTGSCVVICVCEMKMGGLVLSNRERPIMLEPMGLGLRQHPALHARDPETKRS